jgi:2-keto-4-pentenoate hydratase/2-oxohepta-3-ene-1,7-dioic acid hydratase in catechol pathway
VNGETRQTGNSGLMLHPFAKIISFVSKYISLKMGDLIFTGTPAGVAAVKLGDQLTGYLEGEKLLELAVK